MSNNSNTFSIQKMHRIRRMKIYLGPIGTESTAQTAPPQAHPFLSSEQGLQQSCRNAGSVMNILVLPLIGLQSSFSHVLAPTQESWSHM